MKLGIIIAAIVIAVIVAAACLISYVMFTLAETFNKEYKSMSNREALELENDEYNYGHDISHETYGE